MLLVLSLACLAAAVYFVGEVATLPARQRVTSVRRAARYGRVRLAADAGPRFHERVVVPLLRASRRSCSVSTRRRRIEGVAARLLAAGLAQRVSPSTFLAAKGLVAGAAALLGLAVGSRRRPGRACSCSPPVLGRPRLLRPDLIVSTRARSRREAVRAELPDTLDLLAVSVEAGLGFDGAIAKVTEHMEGALVEELGLVLGAMRVGESRQDALKKLAERVPRPSWPRSSARSSRPTSSASRSAGSCASRPPTRASAARPPPRSAR